MNITPLPNTCSAFYLSGITEMEDIKKFVSEHMAKDHAKAIKDKEGKVVDTSKNACVYFATAVRVPAIKALEKAGFKKVAGYFSHRHSHQCSFLMMRPTTRMEWADGKARYPRKKRG